MKAIKKDLIYSENILDISVDPLDYYIAHSLGTADFDIIFDTDQLAFFKEGFEQFDGKLYFFAESEFRSSKTAEFDDLNMALYADNPGLFYATFMTGETELYLSTYSIDDYVLEKVLYDLEAMTYLSTAMGSVLHFEKFADAEHMLQIFAEITEVLISAIVPTESKMTLSCEASTEMTKYRPVSEMDGLPLSEFDNMTLNELNFITIV